MNINKVWTILLIFAITLLAIHLLYTNSSSARLDLTEEGLYTLTEGTKEILEKMEAEGVKPIEMKLYFSETSGKTLPSFIKNFITHRDYVANLLREYERRSAGKIEVEVIDPKTDSDDADDAADFGLEGKPINEQGDQFYFGLAMITQTGSRDKIEFLWPEEREKLEYEVSKKLYGLLWPERKKIGVISSLEPLPDNNPYMMQMMQMQGKQPSEPWTIMQLMQETYDVAMISDTETIDREEYDLLIVIHPKNLPDKTQFAIDEWVVRGGDTIVFVDAYAIEDEPVQTQQNQFAMLQQRRAANMDKLLENWGLRMPMDRYAADFEMGMKQQAQRGAPAETNVTYLGIDERNVDQTLNSDSPFLQGLADVRFYMSGVLEIDENPPVEITPLITTTESGATLEIVPGFGGEDKLSYADMMGNVSKLLDRYQPSGKQILAAQLTGQFPTAFPDGGSFPKEAPQTPPGMPPGFQMPVPEDAEMITVEPVPEDQYQEGRVLVFADVDFISNMLAFQQSFFGTVAVGDNHKVLMNAVDYMLGARELMKVRSKKNIERPFEVFDRIEREADEAVLEEERAIRQRVEQFREELREKQSGMTAEGATILEKRLRDEIEQLNENIRENERKLREIRKQKRAALEGIENTVRFLIVALMPILVCVAGLFVFMKRRGNTRKRG